MSHGRIFLTTVLQAVSKSLNPGTKCQRVNLSGNKNMVEIHLLALRARVETATSD
jgi:hypothetical protein